MFTRKQRSQHSTAYTGVGHSSTNNHQPNSGALAAALTIGNTLKQQNAARGVPARSPRSGGGGGANIATPSSNSRNGSLLKRGSRANMDQSYTTPAAANLSSRRYSNGSNATDRSTLEGSSYNPVVYDVDDTLNDSFLDEITEESTRVYLDNKANMRDLKLPTVGESRNTKAGRATSSSSSPSSLSAQPVRMVKKYIPSSTGIKVIEVPETTIQKEMARSNSMRMNPYRTSSLRLSSSTKPPSRSGSMTSIAKRASTATPQANVKPKPKQQATASRAIPDLSENVKLEESLGKQSDHDAQEVKLKALEAQIKREKELAKELELKKLEYERLSKLRHENEQALKSLENGAELHIPDKARSSTNNAKNNSHDRAEALQDIAKHNRIEVAAPSETKDEDPTAVESDTSEYEVLEPVHLQSTENGTGVGAEANVPKVGKGEDWKEEIQVMISLHSNLDEPETIQKPQLKTLESTKDLEEDEFLEAELSEDAVGGLSSHSNQVHREHSVPGTADSSLSSARDAEPRRESDEEIKAGDSVITVPVSISVSKPEPESETEPEPEPEPEPESFEPPSRPVIVSHPSDSSSKSALAKPLKPAMKSAMKSTSSFSQLPQPTTPSKQQQQQQQHQAAKSNAAQQAYLSLTTAENTRLNSKSSNLSNSSSQVFNNRSPTNQTRVLNSGYRDDYTNLGGVEGGAYPQYSNNNSALSRPQQKRLSQQTLRSSGAQPQQQGQHRYENREAGMSGRIMRHSAHVQPMKPHPALQPNYVSPSKIKAQELYAKAQARPYSNFAPLKKQSSFYRSENGNGNGNGNGAAGPAGAAGLAGEQALGAGGANQVPHRTTLRSPAPPTAIPNNVSKPLFANSDATNHHYHHHNNHQGQSQVGAPSSGGGFRSRLQDSDDDLPKLGLGRNFRSRFNDSDDDLPNLSGSSVGTSVYNQPSVSAPTHISSRPPTSAPASQPMGEIKSISHTHPKEKKKFGKLRKLFGSK
ncbi:uncharacterized protein LODBEIA_P52300 [Lodderomyces beijingensis]|uniref:Eisosome protein SEG1 n=1 Tax=Lodderomyces beijingensis TaxID=1775926 RepID=A0ABP0ZS91_9ASCO